MTGGDSQKDIFIQQWAPGTLPSAPEPVRPTNDLANLLDEDDPFLRPELRLLLFGRGYNLYFASY